MIVTVDMFSNKKPDSIVTKLIFLGKKLNISLAFIPLPYSDVSKTFFKYSAYYFIIKIQQKKKNFNNAIKFLAGIDVEDVMNVNKKNTTKLYSFLINDTTLPSDNFLRFRRNLLERI